MEYSGRIVRWDDEKGFGFIRPASGGAQLFFHISDYRAPSRPGPNTPVLFQITQGRDGKPAANRVRPADVTSPRPSSTPDYHEKGAMRVWLGALILALAFAVAVLDQLPLAATLTYILMSGASFALYAIDKSAARAGRKRIPEATLYLVDFLCGIAGGLIAQQMLRHKTAKPSFAFVSYAIAGWHIMVLSGIALGLHPIEEFIAAAGL